MHSNAKIFIVDDEPMAINYFKMLCEQASPTYEVVGEAYNGVEALPRILEMRPDIAFIDISMPLMNGLELGKKIIKQNPDQKIIFLTSYRDFNYVKTGMDMGVSSYMLKNELTSENLSQEIEKIMLIIKNDKDKARTYLEYNIRNFLAADMDIQEDYVYQQKKSQKYALLYIFQNIPISLRYTELGLEKIDCRDLEQQDFGAGLCCRNAVNTGDGKWCLIFFIDSGEKDTRMILSEASQKTVGIFKDKGVDCRCIISEVTPSFLELSHIYKKVDQLRLYFYAHPGETILFAKELEDKSDNPMILDQLIYEVRLYLKEENKEKLYESVDKALQKAQKHLNVYDYINLYRELYSIIKQWVGEKGLDPTLLELQETYDDVDEALTYMLDWIEEIFKAYHHKQDIGYSKKVSLAIDFIYRNYDKNISLLDIAESVNLSEGHLRKCFKSETGETVLDFLTAYRIERAKKMMEEGKDKINEISAKAGFASNQYFSYVFKKIEGITPGEYMKKNKYEKLD